MSFLPESGGSNGDGGGGPGTTVRDQDGKGAGGMPKAYTWHLEMVSRC